MKEFVLLSLVLMHGILLGVLIMLGIQNANKMQEIERIETVKSIYEFYLEEIDKLKIEKDLL